MGLGVLASNLQIGADITSALPLQSNSRISNTGLILGGRGFILEKEEAGRLLQSSEDAKRMVAPIWNGKDVTDRWREFFVIDTHGLTEESLAGRSPAIWQHLKNTVYPERQANRDPKLQKLWWLFRRANTEVRDAMSGLQRYIVTSETAKHRCFVFLESPAKPEHKLVVVSHDDAYLLGILSSSIHTAWALKIGSQLGPTPVYVKSACFEPFPFPALEEGPLKQKIRDLGERLDAHRKRQQELHPDLTLTGIYNVLEKLRSGETLGAKDKVIHDQGLVSMLKQIHDDLDTAVLEAYGWSDLAAATPCADVLARGGAEAAALEQAILTRLVALNHERAAEEKRGLIRWLRPDFQAPGTEPAQQTEIESIETPADHSKSNIQNSTFQDWPNDLPAQVAAVRKLLPTTGSDPEALAACFGRKNKKRIDQITGILATLRALGLIG
jgi:hypothetical protein